MFVLRKLLDKIPYVRNLKHENNMLQDTNQIWQKEARKLLDENESLKSENQEIRSYVGYLINEPHLIMMDIRGMYTSIDPEKLKQYEGANIEIKQRPPLNTLILYADKIGGVEKNED